jgi:hypothetical protein
LVEQEQQTSTFDTELDKPEVLFCRKSPSQFAGSVKPLPNFQKSIRKRISLPVRTYYHDVTFHPISLTEWLCGNMIDAEYALDNEWRRIADTSVSG